MIFIGLKAWHSLFAYHHSSRPRPSLPAALKTPSYRNTMPASLASRPLDILLLILDLGELDTSDALALRSVCRALYYDAEHRSFWLIVANNIQRRHLLPLPPFRTMASLSAEEIRRVCVRNINTLTNLRSPDPQYRGSRILVLDSQRSPILFFAFLNGGQHGLIAQAKGTVSIWDLYSVLGMDVATSSAPDAFPGAEYTPSGVGTLLGEFYTGFPIQLLEYRTFGPEDRQVIVTTTSTFQSEGTRLTAFEFNFISDNEVTAHQLYQTITTMIPVMATLGSYGSVIFYIESSNLGEWPGLLVINYVRGHSTLIHAQGLPPDYYFAYDMTATDAGDLLIYRTTDRVLEVFAYFGMNDLAKAESGAIILGPHAKRVFTYSEACQFTGRREGSVLHPWNTPNARTLHRLALLTSMAAPSFAEGMDQRTFGVHWLNTDRLVAHLKSDTSTEFSLPFHRTFCHVGRMVPTSSVGGRDLIAFGDSGRNAAWIEVSAGLEEKQERSLHLLPFQSPADDPNPEEGLDLSGHVRTLGLPITLDGATQLDFCDESGVLMVATYGRAPGGMHEQRLHFFQY